MTLTYFTAKSYLFQYAFVWEKDKNNMFVYNIKVGRCSQSNEYMKRYEYTGMTLTYLTAKSYLFPYAFVYGKKIKNNMFVYSIKVGRCSQSNEYMKRYEYQRSRSFIDLHPRSLRLNIFILLLETPKQIEAKFRVGPPWDRGMNMSTTGLCHMTITAAISIYMVKTFKNLLV